MPRLAIIGAGPIGLEAALLGVARGFDVTVLEQDRVGAGVARWAHTRCFSPVGMNQSARARAALGPASPADHELLTGGEIVSRVLVPLAAQLGERVREGTRVVAVGRARMSRGDLAGHPVRGERPFRLLVESAAGEEVLEVDRVLDASGVYGQPVPFGAGPPARGERALEQRGGTLRHLGALDEAIAAGRLDGKRVLLVGHGHSAAHAVAALHALAGRGTTVVWAVRSPNARPIAEVAGDPLPERARVAVRANDLAEAPGGSLVVERRASVEAVGADDGALRVELSGGRVHVIDLVVALTGYRPDLSLLSDLSVEISPATEGAARLARAMSGVTDCLSVPAVRAEDLASGEAGFHLVGNKSYGRARTFLLGTGLAHLETIFAGL